MGIPIGYLQKIIHFKSCSWDFPSNFPSNFLGVSIDFPSNFLGVSIDFPSNFLGVSIDFPSNFLGVSQIFHWKTHGKIMPQKSLGRLGLHCAQDLQLGSTPGSDLKIAGISKGFPMIHLISSIYDPLYHPMKS